MRLSSPPDSATGFIYKLQVPTKNEQNEKKKRKKKTSVRPRKKRRSLLPTNKQRQRQRQRPLLMHARRMRVYGARVNIERETNTTIEDGRRRVASRES